MNISAAVSEKHRHNHIPTLVVVLQQFRLLPKGHKIYIDVAIALRSNITIRTFILDKSIQTQQAKVNLP
jgi:hypothetical protein